MFNLYAISVPGLREHLSFAFQDIVEGLSRYSEEGKDLGFNVIYVEDISVDDLIKSDAKIDGVFSIWGNGVPYNSSVFNKRTYKTATFIDDHHWWVKNDLENRLVLFNNTDVIFSPYHRTLSKYNEYSDFVHKFVSLPWWSIDHCFTTNVAWKERIDKILFSGASGDAYKFREKIIKDNNPLIYRLQHSEYSNFKHQYHGKKFIEYIQSFKGMIATSATPLPTWYDKNIIHPLDYTLQKVFESLGSGCLSFLEETEDFKDLGLVKYEHYIPITPTDFKEKFLYINNIEAEEIALCGRSFVKNNHSTKKRVLSIFKTLKERWL